MALKEWADTRRTANMHMEWLRPCSSSCVCVMEKWYDRLCFCLSSVCAAGFEGCSMVPSIYPLETLHNSLSLKQVDEFLNTVCESSSEVHAKTMKGRSAQWSSSSIIYCSFELFTSRNQIPFNNHSLTCSNCVIICFVEKRLIYFHTNLPLCGCVSCSVMLLPLLTSSATIALSRLLFFHLIICFMFFAPALSGLFDSQSQTSLYSPQQPLSSSGSETSLRPPSRPLWRKFLMVLMV